jgi:hypothetical protein
MTLPLRRRALVLSIVPVFLLAGCGTAGSPASTPSATPTLGALTVEALAAKLGCEAKVTLKAADYRKADCTTSEGRHVLLDFATTTGQRAWLEYAQLYGGIYLVGERWALSAVSRQYMQSLQAKLGGTVEGRASTPETKETTGTR